MRPLTISKPRARAWPIVFLSAMLLVAACDRDNPTAPVVAGPTVPTMRGTVITSATANPVAGATVSIGSATTTTGPDGRFELTNLTAGPATLRCIAIGFDDFEAEIMVPSGSTIRNISLMPVPAALHISGVMGALYQSVRVSRAGAGVTDALVTVNGVAIPHCCGDLYSGKLPEAVPPGSQLELRVSAGGVTVEATGYVLEAPIITAPATGSILASTDFINVTWISATDPDRFEVCLNCWENSLDGAIYQTPGTARELKIAAGDLRDYGNGAIVAVYAMKEDFLSFTGPVDPGSRVLFMSRSPDAVITITP